MKAKVVAAVLAVSGLTLLAVPAAAGAQPRAHQATVSKAACTGLNINLVIYDLCIPL